MPPREKIDSEEKDGEYLAEQISTMEGQLPPQSTRRGSLLATKIREVLSKKVTTKAAAEV